MKTFIAAATLSLVSFASFAVSVPSTAQSSPVQYVFQGDSLAPAFTAPLTKTRAEVLAELKAAQSRMDYVFMGDTWVPRSVFMSERSAAEVRAEARRLAAINTGESRH